MILLTCLLAFQSILVWATAAFENGTTRLSIHIPYRLFKEGGYDHRAALFGIPPYAGSLVGIVYYAQSKLCDSIVNSSTGVPSRSRDRNGTMLPWPAPFILMVDRGDCTFVKKVRNAQHAGASAVIVADTTCLCYDEPCVKNSHSTSCETTEPIMADDGSGGDISIPSFLMFKPDADSVKNELTEDHPVYMKMRWSLPSPDYRVNYEVWTDPSDPSSLDFVQKFQVVATALGSKAYVTPHIYVYDGVRPHCLGNDEHNMCYHLCTNNGRYCAMPPDDPVLTGVSGADVVNESLRRICIWKYYGEKNGIGEKWWNYVSSFTELCYLADYFTKEDCVKNVYQKVGIDELVVARCMNDSGGLIADRVNNLLDAEIRAQNERGVVVVPSVFVDGIALRSALTVDNVFVAICARFGLAKTPRICEQCATCRNPYECIQAGGICSHDLAPLACERLHFSLLPVVLVLVGLTGLLIHWHSNREKVHEITKGFPISYYTMLTDPDD